eukprot:g7058.t1
MTLRFSDPVLEREYVAYRTNTTLLTADWKFLMVNMFSYIPFLLMDVILKRAVFTKPMALKLFAFAVVMVHYLLMLYVNKEFWIRLRGSWISFLRTVRLFAFIIGVPSWLDQPCTDVQSLFKTAILQSGMIVNIWWALGMPLLFYQHLIIQTLQVAITFYVTYTPTCSKILQTEISRQIFAQVMNSVDGILYTLAGMQKRSNASPERLVAICPKLLVLGHSVIALLIPTMVLWKMEIVSRKCFIRELNRHEQWSGIQLDASWVPDIGRVLVIFAVSASTCWTLLADF